MSASSFYLDEYLRKIRSGKNPQLADAIQKTVQDIVPQYIESFDFMDNVVSLLVGDVQSGKTSHMFGLMCAAADKSFRIFILLTTDNILLQQQTLKRAEKDLSDFCICGEDDFLKFKKNNLSKPTVIILKKNARVLNRWKNNLSSSSRYCKGNPFFIVDDEADASSLNTKVNKRKQSTINKTLEEIKHIALCSIYLEVTGTPQSLLLQTTQSGWKPLFMYYFNPGKGYLGGNFFFPPEPPKQVIFTDDEEGPDLLADDEFPENGLKKALIIHLITSGHTILSGGNVCNFLIHPSVKTDQHAAFANKVGCYLNEIAHSYNENETKTSFKEAYQNLKETCPYILPLERIYEFIINLLQNDKIRILTLNSKVSYADNTQYENGVNILIGGNSLGRGVTFPHLQTIYYCRVSKRPQADTMWQHARMFGYDRNPSLMRLFIPPKLFKLFSDINNTNNALINQIKAYNSTQTIEISYPPNIRPTRKNVVDQKSTGLYSGGVNYFPLYPQNKSIQFLDTLLSKFPDGEYYVALPILKKILEQIDSEIDDWKPNVFISCLNSFLSADPGTQGMLIIRRNRDIGKGTGTLLSPNDRKIGDSHPDITVLTVYKITGNPQKGWNSEQIWIPNIKLPGKMLYYIGDSNN